ncbi:MAG: type II secretion system F family protein [Bacteriovoracales bacterium]|nr:type II secretion system F family protein [Bacteriovoracales bacterium]
MIAFTQILGKTGLLILIFAMIFLYIYINSVKLFQWIEDQTLGTRAYILEKLNLLFIKVDPDKLTYLLLFLSFGLSSLVMGLFLLFGYWKSGIILSIFIGVLGWKIPRPLIDYLVKRRIKAYQNQMVDALNLLGNGLKAGLSFNQGMRMVVDEISPPISQEFKRVLDENSLGQPLEECLENLSKRIPLPENDMFVTSVNILKESGGNLADIFSTITDVIRERIRLQQKVDTFTAQGKVQATIISLMPSGMLLVYTASDPESMGNVFTQPLGVLLLGVAFGLNIVGYFVIRKVITIKT